MALIPKRFATFFSIPILRRAAFHAKRLTSGLERTLFVRIGVLLVGFLIIGSALVTLAERHKDGHTWHTFGGFLDQFMDWLYWSVTTVIGVVYSSQVHSPICYVFSWL